MIFRVDSSLFERGSARSADLISLLRNAATRSHTLWVVDNPGGTTSEESERFSTWVSQLDERLRREVGWIRETLRRLGPHAVSRDAVVIIVAVDDPTPMVHRGARVDLMGAVRLAGMPLSVLVENARSDAAFLRRVMPPRWRKKLAQWEREGSVRFEHAGGVDEMRKIVEHFAADGSQGRPGIDAPSWRATHFLVADRDTQPGGQEGGSAQKLRTACNRCGLVGRLHVLKRRDQESYIPRPALDQIVAMKTADADRLAMENELDNHFAGENAHQDELPGTWFKNAFIVHGATDWDDAWFEQDGAWPEMVTLAETIASLR